MPRLAQLIAGISTTALMSTNLYSSGDNYHLEYSRVVAALIRRFHEGFRRLRCRGCGPGRLPGSLNLETVSLNTVDH
jgi:nucleoside-diphosphate-sugar epimerase